MPNPAKLRASYILSPDLDCSVDGPIFIGSILQHPRKPYGSLSDNDDTAKDLARLATRSEKRGWSMAEQGENTVDFGIFTSLLAPLLGAGVDAGGAFSRGISSNLKVNRLETEFVKSTSNLLLKILKSSDVWPTIQQKKIPPLYIVTGRKLAYGLSASESAHNELAPTAGATVNLTQFGAPADVGIRTTIKNWQERTIGFDGSSDIVLAYQVRRVVYDKKTRSFTSEEYNKHVSLSRDDETEDDPWAEALAAIEDGDKVVEDIEVSGVEAEDVGLKQLGRTAFISSCVDDEGEICEIFSSFEGGGKAGSAREND